ncbi:MAG TPA: DUF4388 domain-containing protein [candidate division Zixibacteria bacterium]|jgi:DNA-binding response OmpR family regulator
MASRQAKRRLDEILVSEGLVSEQEIRDALLRQKAEGGKFGSQLLYHRTIDEATLVKALAIQFGCEGVVLSDRAILPSVVAMVPAKVATARRVMPFDFDRRQNVLKIACENPGDENLIKELNFVVGGKQIRLFVAAEIALSTAIARYYLGRDISLADQQLLDIPDGATDTGKIAIGEKGQLPDSVADVRPALLLVTDEIYTAPLIQSLFERDGYHVEICESADDALELVGNRRFQALFIRSSVSGDYIHLIDRARRISARTVIRFYSSASDLMLSKGVLSTPAELLISNLELFTSLLSSKARLPVNHGARVGQYADRLCRKLEIPDKDRVMISNAAYVHDLARYYYSSDQVQDNRSVVRMTVKLLTSLNYSAVVLEMLRRMYADVAGKYTARLPIEVLGGNILTIVDVFCDSVTPNDRLSLDRFDAVKKKLRDQVGSMFLLEVVEAFIEMIQEELLDQRTTRSLRQVMIFAEDLARQQSLEMRLRNEGYPTVSQNSINAVVELISRREPDVLILAIPGDVEAINIMVSQLESSGIDFGRIPTLLLTDASSLTAMTGLLERGLEDIIALEDNLDLLVSKLRKLEGKILAARKQQSGNLADAVGARGRLADMNLMDLLQVLGPGRKTVRVTVEPNGPDKSKLRIYLNAGVLTFAKSAETEGPDAVYEGLTWTDGTWTVEPVDTDVLPPPNNQLSNESILMEGCRLLDERVRSGQLL